ncbi:MAG: CUAEP/CCAEP-tail radical SAM (seleno)protein, partial [Nitrospiraceae bacterium]
MDLITLQKRVTAEGCFSLRQPGAILLISCYELGHQPVGIAQPLGVLEQAGYAPAALDIAVEEFDADRVKRARFIGISVPMHTALRLGVRVADLIRKTNPACHICFYGLYASINADYLLTDFADSVIGGEYETPLVALIESLDRNHEDLEVEGVSRRGRIVGPFLKRPRLPFAVSSRRNLPPLTRYARLERDGSRHVVGYVETSRGCKHMCRHCPIVPVYE